MNIDLRAALKHTAINEWRLFGLIAIPVSIVMVVAMLAADMSTGPGVSTMISFSVRVAVPFIFLVVAISSIQTLFPGPFSMWLLRNRKYFGLCFAVAMAWQGLFIFIMSNYFRRYYYDDLYLFRDQIEGSIGYIFLTAMVVTSFNFGRKHLNPRQWKVLHKCGLYFLFGYAFGVYWLILSYYPNPAALDYVFYWGGFIAFALRIAAWGKKRLQATKKNAPESDTPLAFKVLGGATIVFGLFASAASLYIPERIAAFLTRPEWSENLVLWLPFWPFEPFLSLFIIGLGTLLVTKARPYR
jgi:DMSO/TMAO reductase YedYZ heme-binding membrane subunit